MTTLSCQPNSSVKLKGFNRPIGEKDKTTFNSGDMSSLLSATSGFVSLCDNFDLLGQDVELSNGEFQNCIQNSAHLKTDIFAHRCVFKRNLLTEKGKFVRFSETKR